MQRNHDEYIKSDIEMYSHSEMNEWKKYVSLVYVDKMSYKTRSIQLLLLHKYTGLFSLCVTNKFASIVNFPLRNWAISSSTSTAFSEGYSRSCCCSIPFRYLHIWKVTHLCFAIGQFRFWFEILKLSNPNCYKLITAATAAAHDMRTVKSIRKE